MKRLILLRHAKSSWKYDNIDDFYRPLNKRGKRDLEIVARLIDKHDIDLIMSSTAVRATNTILGALRILGDDRSVTFYDGLYHASADALLTNMKEVSDTVDTLLVCSHNPGITDLVNEVTGARIENVPTSGFVVIDFDVESWSDVDRGAMVGFYYPKMF